MSPRPIARVAPLALIAAIVAMTTGCAARADRFAGVRSNGPIFSARGSGFNAHEDAASPPDLGHGEMTSRAGFASFHPGVRLRDDTPSLTHVLEAERAQSAPRPDATAPWASDGPSGPLGTGGCPCATPYVIPPPIYVSPYFGPIGGFSPGLRPPSPTELPARVFTAPPSANPDADTWRHRPGLSTGSGIYAR